MYVSQIIMPYPLNLYGVYVNYNSIKLGGVGERSNFEKLWLHHMAGKVVLAVDWEISSSLPPGPVSACLGFLSTWQLGSKREEGAAGSSSKM